jgi:hypothetical protein
MGPGQAAYEAKKQQKKDLKMRREKTAEEYARHNEQMDEVGALSLAAAKAFLTGEASLIVETVDDNTKRITFQMPKS